MPQGLATRCGDSGTNQPPGARTRRFRFDDGPVAGVCRDNHRPSDVLLDKGVRLNRTRSLTAIATLMVGLVVVPASPASAAGCAVLDGVWQEGSSRYARVYNACATGPSNMRPTIPGWPDPDCKTIGSYGKATFRTGGTASPYATDAVQC